MALYWEAKPPGAVKEYTWTPKPCESVGDYTIAVATGTATIDIEVDGSDIKITVTGGAADSVQIIGASVNLGNGETVFETIYVPIIVSSNRLGYTVRDTCSFALRKIIGADANADDVELDDAIDRLNAMLAFWKPQGADIGVPLPVDAGDTLYVSDAFIQGIRANLIIECADLYGFEVTPQIARNALRGLQLIKTSLLSTDTRRDCYY